ncbi:branched-chain alpha-keto acid dehydrogenase subunit E2 [Streptomyces sp. WAC 06738]|uniref:dihydrolipoamide acetyltransferase family protein n=1 Tax=Streptomyces sp. WAC 06738 TaxID=2203210 RepID=UPI000F6FB8AB|nr:dihydrolipoamide acetyltransferase family protein [Streptomyces sp. WAC 06738]AZM50831.1 branched-chain alpha-keto acid dehydrogenase subunit E2 [Streptomyces sp. WAC 06738]
MPEVREFALPDLGEGLTEAEIVTWLVDVGDVIAVDQPVVEVETAKAMVEVPCPYGGVVTARHGDPGTEVPVGSVLVTVAVEAGTGSGSGGGYRDRIEDRIRGAGAADGGPAGTDGVRADGARADGVVADARAAAEFAGEETGGSGNVLVGYGTSAGGARRRRRSAGAGRTSLGGGPVRPGAGAPAPRGAKAPEVPADGPVAVISPLVRRIARESGLDLRAITGSGPHGLILRADVEAAVRAGTPAGRGAAAAVGRTAVDDGAVGAGARTADGGTAGAVAAGAGLAEGERVPLRGVRGAIADKLSRSRREIPDVTCWVDADATELLDARRAMNAAAGDRPAVSLLALLGRVCTAALARYPELNSTVQGREIVRLPAVHLGFAAQTDRGLVVPVVRDAHALSAERLSAEMARLTEAARAGTLTPAELTGGTFTLNNYGVFGVDGSTPILNHPEAGMLGVGRIAEKPWVHRGELAVRRVVELSFTFDHRVCDGGTAGGFLRYVADCVEHPAVLLRAL